MMTKYCTLFCLTALFAISVSNAQVGVNTTNPASVLDVAASDATAPNEQDGILIPRIEDFPVTNPGAAQDGMLVFLNTDSGSDPRGFYYWDNPNTRWVGFGSGTSTSSGEWRDGQNDLNEDLIYAIQAGAAAEDIVFLDDGTNGASFGIGTDDPVERFELKGDGDNDVQLTSANTNPPNYIVQNAGGTIDMPTPIDPTANRGEIGSFVAKTYSDNTNSVEVGGNRFFVDDFVSSGVIPMRYGITLRDITNNVVWNSDQLERFSILSNGNIGLSNPDPTAGLHLQRGTTAAGTAPLKFGGYNTAVYPGTDSSNQPPAQALMTNPEAGALEYDGDHLYITDDANVRHEIATVGGGGGGSSNPATITQSLWFGNIGANSTSDGSYAPYLGGAETNMTCSCSPTTALPAGLIWSCYVSGTNNVRIRVANVSNSSISAGNLTFNISVFKQD